MAFSNDTNQQQFEAAVAQLARALSTDVYCWWAKSIDMHGDAEVKMLEEAKPLVVEAVEHLKLYGDSGTNAAFVARICAIHVYISITRINKGTIDIESVVEQLEQGELQQLVVELSDVEMTAAKTQFQQGISRELEKFVLAAALRSWIDDSNEAAATHYEQMITGLRPFAQALDQRGMVYLLVAAKQATAGAMDHVDLYPFHGNDSPKCLAYAEKVMLDLSAP